MSTSGASRRGALKLLGSVAWASSIFGLGLVAEERRRQIAFAQRVIENGKKLQAYKSYHVAAPLETFLPEDEPLVLAHSETDAGPQWQSIRTFSRNESPLQELQLQREEWLAKSRKRKIIPKTTVRHKKEGRSVRNVVAVEKEELVLVEASTEAPSPLRIEDILATSIERSVMDHQWLYRTLAEAQRIVKLGREFSNMPPALRMARAKLASPTMPIARPPPQPPPTDQGNLSSRMTTLLRGEHALEALDQFFAFSPTERQPLSEHLRTTMTRLLDAVKSLGLDSLAFAMQQRAILLFDDWAFALHDLPALELLAPADMVREHCLLAIKALREHVSEHMKPRNEKVSSLSAVINEYVFVVRALLEASSTSESALFTVKHILHYMAQIFKDSFVSVRDRCLAGLPEHVTGLLASVGTRTHFSALLVRGSFHTWTRLLGTNDPQRFDVALTVLKEHDWSAEIRPGFDALLRTVCGMVVEYDRPDWLHVFLEKSKETERSKVVVNGFVEALMPLVPTRLGNELFAVGDVDVEWFLDANIRSMDVVTHAEDIVAPYRQHSAVFKRLSREAQLHLYQAYAASGQLSGIDDVFQNLSRYYWSNREISDTHCSLLLRVWKSSSNLDYVMSVFEQIRGLGRPSQNVLHTVMQTVAFADTGQTISTHIAFLQSLGLQITADTHFELLRSLGNYGQWEHIETAIDQLVETHSPPPRRIQGYLTRLAIDYSKDAEVEDTIAFAERTHKKYKLDISRKLAVHVSKLIFAGRHVALMDAWLKLLNLKNLNLNLNAAFEGSFLLGEALTLRELRIRVHNSYFLPVAAASLHAHFRLLGRNYNLVIPRAPTEKPTRALNTLDPEIMPRDPWIADFYILGSRAYIEKYEASLIDGLPPTELALCLAIRAATTVQASQTTQLDLAESIFKRAVDAGFRPRIAQIALQIARLRVGGPITIQAAFEMLEAHFQNPNNFRLSVKQHLPVALAANLSSFGNVGEALQIMQRTRVILDRRGIALTAVESTMTLRLLVSLSDADGIREFINRMTMYSFKSDSFLLDAIGYIRRTLTVMSRFNTLSPVEEELLRALRWATPQLVRLKHKHLGGWARLSLQMSMIGRKVADRREAPYEILRRGGFRLADADVVEFEPWRTLTETIQSMSLDSHTQDTAGEVVAYNPL